MVNVNLGAGTTAQVDWLTNNGVINVNSGTLKVGANNTSDSGDWNVAAGARLDFTLVNGLTNPTRTSSGDVTVNGGTLGFGFGLVTFTTGTVTFSGATAALDITVNNVVFNNVIVAPGRRSIRPDSASRRSTGRSLIRDASGPPFRRDFFRTISCSA